jgi:hypothetical protein
MTDLLSSAVLLATKGPDPDDVTAGWAGFLVFIGLAIAVVVLWLSFRKQLKKIDFEEEPDEPGSSDPAAGEPTDGEDPVAPEGSADPPERSEP